MITATQIEQTIRDETRNLTFEQIAYLADDMGVNSRLYETPEQLVQAMVALEQECAFH